MSSEFSAKNIQEHFEPVFQEDDVESLVRLCKGLDVNKEYVYGGTLCHMACVANAPRCLFKLIAMGADISKEFDTSPSLFHTSLWNSGYDQRCMRILLETGCDQHEDLLEITSGRRSMMVTPFDYAANRSHVDTCELLYEYGVRGGNKLQKRIEEQRRACRKTAIVMASLTRKSEEVYVRTQDVNVLRLVAKHVWSFRLGDAFRKKRKYRHPGDSKKPPRETL